MNFTRANFDQINVLLDGEMDLIISNLARKNHLSVCSNITDLVDRFYRPRRKAEYEYTHMYNDDWSDEEYLSEMLITAYSGDQIDFDTEDKIADEIKGFLINLCFYCEKKVCNLNSYKCKTCVSVSCSDCVFIWCHSCYNGVCDLCLRKRDFDASRGEYKRELICKTCK